MNRFDSRAARDEVSTVGRDLQAAKARLLAVRHQLSRTKGLRRQEREAHIDPAMGTAVTGRLLDWAGRIDIAIAGLDEALRELRGIARPGRS